jgi:hypothetical protein
MNQPGETNQPKSAFGEPRSMVSGTEIGTSGCCRRFPGLVRGRSVAAPASR